VLWNINIKTKVYKFINTFIKQFIEKDIYKQDMKLYFVTDKANKFYEILKHFKMQDISKEFDIREELEPKIKEAHQDEIEIERIRPNAIMSIKERLDWPEQLNTSTTPWNYAV
jgi:hypothetical protein